MKRVIEVKCQGLTDSLFACACGAVGLDVDEVLRHLPSEGGIAHRH